MSSELEETKEWIEKGAHDLLSARILTENNPPVFDTASFHSQQAAEKILKAFLVWKNVCFEKVHSLSYLLDMCEREEPGLAFLRDKAEILSPYAVEIRYPGEALEVSKEEAKEALSAANQIWNAVLSFLPHAMTSDTINGGETQPRAGSAGGGQVW